jgi:hypothetical protein
MLYPLIVSAARVPWASWSVGCPCASRRGSGRASSSRSPKSCTIMPRVCRTESCASVSVLCGRQPVLSPVLDAWCAGFACASSCSGPCSPRLQCVYVQQFIPPTDGKATMRSPCKSYNNDSIPDFSQISSRRQAPSFAVDLSPPLRPRISLRRRRQLAAASGILVFFVFVDWFSRSTPLPCRLFATAGSRRV